MRPQIKFTLSGENEMTIAAVKEFLTKASEDTALQAELAKAMEAENDREAVTALAKTKGYNFSAAELAQAVQENQKAAEEQGELSDAELESVAGGDLSGVYRTIKYFRNIPPAKW